jgi:AbrB family looped-hinge helix DNA binding protein
MEKMTVSDKGQVVIPSKIRRRFKIKKGTRLCLEERGEEMVIKVLDEDYFNRLAGVLPGKGRLSKALLNERARDRDKEG